MKKRFLRWGILLLIGFGIGSAIGYIQSQNELGGGVIDVSPDTSKNATVLKASKRTKQDTASGSVDIGGDFELVDHHGKVVTQDNYADSYKLIFFGFTFCPAVCPTELQKVHVIMDELGDVSEKITPLFITVDPARDTVDVMNDYVGQFHPKLVGLTGSLEQIEIVKKAFRVYSSKVENEMMDGYMVDHSAFLYLMSPENGMIALYPSKDTAIQIAEDIKGRNL